MKRIPLMLGYDRFLNAEDPLLNIIQCLWNNNIDTIHRFVDSTLEFSIEEADSKEKIDKLYQELEQIAHIRFSSPLFIKGDGNAKLDSGLQDYIKEQVLFGALKRPKGWNG